MDDDRVGSWMIGADSEVATMMNGWMNNRWMNEWITHSISFPPLPLSLTSRLHSSDMIISTSSSAANEDQ